MLFLAKLQLFHTRMRTEINRNKMSNFISVWICLIRLYSLFKETGNCHDNKWSNHALRQSAMLLVTNVWHVWDRDSDNYNSHLHIYKPRSSHFIREQATTERRRAMSWFSDGLYLGRVRWWTEIMKYFKPISLLSKYISQISISFINKTM